jgi:hypothetical protein
LLLLIWYGLSTKGEDYICYSPDGQYRVYGAVYNFALWIPVPFLKYRDLTGRVYLYDELEEKIIDSATIQPIESISYVQWYKNEVYFLGGNEISFKLPREIEFKEKR